MLNLLSRVLVGNGAAPPFSAAANKNMLAKTQPAKNVAVINNKATQRINPHTGEVIQGKSAVDHSEELALICLVFR